MHSLDSLLKNLDDWSEVITAFIMQGQLTWVVCDKDLWFDTTENLATFFEQSFDPAQHQSNSDQPRQWLQLNIDDLPRLLGWMSHYHVSTAQLRAALQTKLPPKTCWDLFEFQPTFYINVDQQCFVSHYSEPIEYEEYVSPLWTSRYDDIMPLIPTAERYWEINGVDWLSLSLALPMQLGH